MKLIASVDSDIGAALREQLAPNEPDLLCTSRRQGRGIPLELAHPLTWPKFMEQSITECWFTIGIGDGRNTRNEVVQINAFLSCDFLTMIAQRGLRDGAKVVVLTSEWGSIRRTYDALNAPANMGYRMSKAALNMGVAMLARRYPQFNWILMQPGWVNTKMNRMPGRDVLSPSQCAEHMLARVAAEQRQFCWIDFLGQDVDF